MGRQPKKKLKALFNCVHVFYFVSGRAGALINLAEEKFKTTSVADLFHLKQCINRLLSLALGRRLSLAQSAFEAAKETCTEICPEEDAYTEVLFYSELYVESAQGISHCIHPYYEGNKANSSQHAQQCVEKELDKIKQAVEGCGLPDKHGLMAKAESQVGAAVSVIGLWHDIAAGEFKRMGLAAPAKIWAEAYLLPRTYWETAAKKTKYMPAAEKIKQEIKACGHAEMPPCITEAEASALKEKCIDLCRMFQRSSSQVEGRNGYLSMMNHNQRGFDGKRLEALTVVHNFDIRGADGKTPAERLFKNQIEHKPVFDFLMENFGTLGLPRRRNNKHAEG